MLYSHILRYPTAAGLITAMLSAPAAHAGPLLQGPDGTMMIPGAIQLTPTQLATIRGGFDFGPKFSIDFAFQQIDTVNGTVVQSIMVPNVTLTSPSDGTPSWAGASRWAGSSPSAGVTSPSAGVPITVTNSDGTTNTVTPPPGSPITLTNSANNGMTQVISTLGNGGISNVVSNEANNAMASVATTANIGITGMSQWLTRQQINSNIQNSLLNGNGGFK